MKTILFARSARLPSRCPLRLVCGALLGVLLATGSSAALAATPTTGGMGSGAGMGGGIDHNVPTQAYFSHFNTLYDGDYRDALELFKNDLASAIKTSQSRWIDSICYYTMVGESYYHLGDYGKALDNYNAALELATAFPNWMMQVQFPAAIRPRGPTTQIIPWGKSTRGATVGQVPATMTISQGQAFVTPQQLVQGGVFSQAQLTPINVVEIVRCTVLAMKRRAEIMGPVCPNDKLTADIAATFARRPGPANHWSEAWLDAELGMAYVGTGQTGQAIGLLQRGLMLSGQYDHPLTPMLLETLGELSLDSGNFKSASNFFEEASYSSVDFLDWGILEASFRNGLTAWLMSHPNDKNIFPPLNKAIDWSRLQHYELRASLLLLAAENHVAIGGANAAAAALTEAKRTVNLHWMGKCDIGSRLHFVTAQLDYLLSKVPDGDKECTAALEIQKNCSKWLFQIGLADYFVAGAAGPHLGAHRALALYELLLRDPTATDWMARPLETLSVLSTPHAGVYEHWFENTLQGGLELSLEVADRTRRHRFYSTLPLGGRLLSLRWVLEAPADALDKVTQLERQELLTRYPQYDDLAKQVRKLRADLAAAPLAADGFAAQKKQADALTEIGKLSAEQEVLLRTMALSREASNFVFPPFRMTKEVQANLPPRHLMLMFFSTANNLYACLISKDRYASWKIESPQMLERRIAGLLRAMGNFDSLREVPQSVLSEETWRQAAWDVNETLLAGSKVNLSENIDELIIVPDGFLWYLPFEALPVSPTGGKMKSLKDAVPMLTNHRVRYLPTMGLAMPDRSDRSQTPEVGIVVNKLHPRDDIEFAQNEFERFRKGSSHVAAIKGSAAVPSPLYGSLFDTLVVYDDIAASKKGAYDWSAIPATGIGPSARQMHCRNVRFALPWKSPVQIILPGFHTPAETGLKAVLGNQATGNEMFLSVCGLMSTGTRTVLLSRWRTGGESSYQLIRNFAQELPFASAADAWQRSVQLLCETPLDLTAEPRVKAAPGAAAMTGKHPFFWAGYMLCDTGWSPVKADKQPAPAVIKLAPAAAAPAPRK